MEIVAEMDHLEPSVGRHSRNMPGSHVQQNDALVQHLVVLKIVQEWHRNHIDSASKIDGGAGYPCLTVHLRDEVLQRQRIAFELAREREPALPPSRHGKEERRGNDQRHPAALDDLHHVGGDE